MVTIFTPTYNRAFIIEKLYVSLKSQTNKNFEWIVIDDGSTDNTEKLFCKWLEENNQFSIKYKKVKNGGKHRAINRGLDIANGELFFIVDSDDYLVNNAVDKVIQWYGTIVDNEKICGIVGSRGYNLYDIIGTTFSGEYKDVSYINRKKVNISGDKAEIFLTDILRKYKFPEFEDENFLQEDAVWLKMGQDYIFRYFNEIIYITNYLEDGLTKNVKKLIINNPRGIAYVKKIEIKAKKFNIKQRLSHYYYYYKTYDNNLTKSKICEYIEIKKITLLISIVIFGTINKFKNKNFML